MGAAEEEETAPAQQLDLRSLVPFRGGVGCSRGSHDPTRFSPIWRWRCARTVSNKKALAPLKNRRSYRNNLQALHVDTG
jgi:hypothetical protein